MHHLYIQNYQFPFNTVAFAEKSHTCAAIRENSISSVSGALSREQVLTLWGRVRFAGVWEQDGWKDDRCFSVVALPLFVCALFAWLAVLLLFTLHDIQPEHLSSPHSAEVDFSCRRPSHTCRIIDELSLWQSNSLTSSLPTGTLFPPLLQKFPFSMNKVLALDGFLNYSADWISGDWTEWQTFIWFPFGFLDRWWLTFWNMYCDFALIAKHIHYLSTSIKGVSEGLWRRFLLDSGV